MTETVQKALEGIDLGEAQVFHNLAVFPVLDGHGMGPDYITLAQAFQEATLTVEEVSEGGSVPELKVANKGERPVLMLDGEELIGAKQNRVMNATVLLAAHTETVINVSCTERGRWSYKSRQFDDSDVVMARRARAGKSRSVAASLKQSGRFRSDQGKVWEDIDAMSRESEVFSETGAMRDVFERRAPDLERVLAAFARVDRQSGLVFVVDGSVVGLDMVSRAEAYMHLHRRLLKSYVIDAPVKHSEERTVPPARDVVEAFLAKFAKCEETHYSSVGAGDDYRYESPVVCGSALVHEDTVVHTALFANEDDARSQHEEPGIRGMRYRRRLR